MLIVATLPSGEAKLKKTKKLKKRKKRIDKMKSRVESCVSGNEHWSSKVFGLNTMELR